MCALVNAMTENDFDVQPGGTQMHLEVPAICKYWGRYVSLTATSMVCIHIHPVPSIAHISCDTRWVMPNGLAQTSFKRPLT
jgi:hypothetical protein